MGKLYLCMAWAIALCLSCQTSAIVVNFDDLGARQDISGSTPYHDLQWEFGNRGVNSHTGSWAVPDYPSDPDNDYYNFPYSNPKNLTNSWGCTQIGFQFPVDKFEHGAIVSGAYFAVQGFVSNWAQAVSAKGYKNDAEIWSTSSMTLTATPQWLAMGEVPVDRVVIFTTPKTGKNYGYFGMDDLTFDIVPEPMTLLILGLGAAFIRRRK